MTRNALLFKRKLRHSGFRKKNENMKTGNDLMRLKAVSLSKLKRGVHKQASRTTVSAEFFYIKASLVQ